MEKIKNLIYLFFEKKASLMYRLVYALYRTDPTEYYISKKLRTIYIVNSKSGCSSIKSALLIKEYGNILFQHYNDVHRISRQRDKIRYINPKLYLNTSRYYVFSTVREPMSRLASFYKNKIMLENETSWYFNNLYVHRRRFYPRMKWADFVDVFLDIPDVESDRHFMSQKRIIYRHGFRPEIFKIENNGIENSLKKVGIFKLAERRNNTTKNSLIDTMSHDQRIFILERYLEDYTEFSYDINLYN